MGVEEWSPRPSSNNNRKWSVYVCNYYLRCHELNRRNWSIYVKKDEKEGAQRIGNLLFWKKSADKRADEDRISKKTILIVLCANVGLVLAQEKIFGRSVSSKQYIERWRPYET